MAALVLVGSESPEEGSLQLEDGEVIQVGSGQWHAWLSINDSFRFESGFAGHNSFTARKQERDSGAFWYAYRKMGGKSKSAYLGKSKMLTVAKMLEVAAKLSEPAKPKLVNDDYTKPSISSASEAPRLDKMGYTQPDVTEAIEALRQEFSAKLAEMEERLERVEAPGKQTA